jgi:predicted ester cyclase
MLEITWEGTQSGPLQTPAGELPPSNRHVRLKAAEILDIENDRIKEAHHYFDLAGMMQQLAATR